MVNTLPLLDIRLKKIENLYVGRSWHDTNYRDSYTRLYYIMGGEGYISHSGGDFPLTPGFIYLIPEYTRHDYRHKGNMKLYYIHCQIRTPAGISFFDLYDCDYVINSKAYGLGFYDFEQLRHLSKKNDVTSLLASSGQLLSLISPFVRQVKSGTVRGADKDLARLMGVVNYIEEHLPDDPSVVELAAMVNMERSAFSRLFSRVLGTAPGKFIQKKRIESARQLLDSSNLSCEDVGEKLGFYDSSHFSRIFKRETGVRPGEYREKRRLNNKSNTLNKR